MRIAADASKLVFDRGADPREFSAGVLEALMQELPSATIDLGGSSANGSATATAADGSAVAVPVKTGPDGAGIDVLDAFVVAGLVKSKGDARRLLQQGGLYANGEKLGADNGLLSASGAIHGSFYVLRKGARDIAIVRLVNGS